MTEPAVVERTVPAPPKVSFWEELIDIFFSPVGVFRRQENKSFWPPMLFVALSIGVIVFVTFNTLEPIFDAEFTRSTAKQVAGNPTPEQLELGKRIGMNVARFGVTIIMMLTMSILGIFTWLVGKLVGSQQSVHAAFVVAAWSYVPRVLGAILGGVQGLVMDTSKFNSQLSISLSPARFMDADAANPLLYQLAGRFDLITIWVTILLAVGMYVTGKVSKGRAATFGVLIWVLGALPALRAAFLAM
jgi:Yip1-like protein